MAAMIVASLLIGAASMSVSLDDPRSVMLLLESRIPRTLAVLLTGAALAVAGVVMQQIVQNRFVGPDTVGTSESAALGLLLVTIYLPTMPIWGKMLCASLSALAGTALFVQIARRIPPHNFMMVPLVGIIFAGVVQSVVSFIAWQTDLVQYIGIWLMTGEFSGVLAGRYEMLWIAGIGAALSWFVADQFAILGLGREASTGLGLNYDRIVRLGLIVVAVTTAMIVATVGAIPFIGLIVPNIVVRFMGDNLRRSIPVIAWFGACLTLACDLLARTIRPPFEIPVGSILGVIGAAIFLVLLYRRRRYV
ncbi:ABC transporter permease [Paracoccaceae bacterium GXU_MW_L88]